MLEEVFTLGIIIAMLRIQIICGIVWMTAVFLKDLSKKFQEIELIFYFTPKEMLLREHKESQVQI